MAKKHNFILAWQAAACMMSLFLALPATEARADELNTVTTVWVSADGNDTNDGSHEQPLATPQRALQMVREMRQTDNRNSLGEVHIVLMGGTYYLSNTLVLTKDDSGTSDSPTIIEAEDGQNVVLSGGTVVRNWEPTENVEGLPQIAQGHVWKAIIPQAGNKPVPFR